MLICEVTNDDDLDLVLFATRADRVDDARAKRGWGKTAELEYSSELFI